MSAECAACAYHWKTSRMLKRSTPSSSYRVWTRVAPALWIPASIFSLALDYLLCQETVAPSTNLIPVLGLQS